MDEEGHAPTNKRRKTEEADLTDEAWLLVFIYLGIADRTRIVRVCRRWRELARKSITKLSFEGIFKCLSEGGSHSHQMTDDILSVCLQQYGTHLRSLNISSTSPNHSLTRRALDLVALYGTSLQELDLSHMYHLKNAALKKLAKKIPRLRSLSLQRCHCVDVKGLGPALKTLQSLKSLNVGGNKWINDELFSQVPQSLIEVIADDCRQLTDRGVHFLVERCPNLNTIDISLCSQVTGQSIADLAKNCPRLKRFRFSVWKDKSLLNEGDFLTLSNLPLLEEINLGGHTAGVTDQFFYELGKQSPLLQSISCRECQQLTDAAISHLSPCLHLEAIDLSWCDHITDQGLVQLSSAHSQLKEVGVARCRGITDEGVSHLLSDNPNLLKLDITRCPHVTDRGLDKLESDLRRRQHTQPLEIRVHSPSISSEKVDEFKGNSNVNFIYVYEQ